MSDTTDGRRGLALFRENVATVWTSRNVRRIQLAYLGAALCQWAYAMAIMVWAYHEGGAVLVGAWAGVRFLLTAVLTPIGGTIADRMSRRDYMLAVNAICFVLVGVTAATIFYDLNMWAVLVPATLLSIVGSTFRPAQAGLLPQLVENPKQLTSANATAEIIESTAQFIGPAIAGVLLGLVGVVPVVLLEAVGLAWSLVLVAGVTRDSAESRSSAPALADAPVEAKAEAKAGAQTPVEVPAGSTAAVTSPVEPEQDAAEEGSFLVEAAGGFAAIAKDRDLVAMSGLLVVNGILAGLVNVLIVVVAAQMLGDANQVGLLNAVLGAATFAGGFIILGLAGRVKLGRLMVIGVLGWCLPLLVLGVAPSAVVVFAAFVVIGLCDPMINVGFGTIPPRLVPDRVLSRVFAAIESTLIGAAALGAFLTPILIGWLGLGTALIALGVVSTVLALVCAVRIPHLDARLTPPRGLSLLEKVDLFRPLAPQVLDRIAHRLAPVSVPAGYVIVSEGGISDRFYLIESGEVEVTKAGRPLRVEDAGDVFGEIGLLRDVPRTATVRATRDTVLLTLERDDFLDLVSSDAGVLGSVQELATRRLVT
ncbi:MFS transporter [Microbacterium sp.]|uniref:MFS transporter n=1 Tax=Microbacterium sp. TaxID=51671 RepID=UPI003A94A56A